MNPILSASITNCHVTGLDSIVFKQDAPMVRVYLAHKNHVLWRNKPDSGNVMSLGIHQHRQDITMVPLFGNVSNVLIDKQRILKPRICLHRYIYSSQIADGKGGFKYIIGDHWVIPKEVRLIYPTFLRGDVAHSVYVPKGEIAAWMICEGKPNEYYNSELLTNDPNLEKADISGLYQPMTQERLTSNMLMLSL